jgi:hypothetical protein
MERLIKAKRVQKMKTILRYIRYFDDHPVQQITNTWMDIGGAVQTALTSKYM